MRRVTHWVDGRPWDGPAGRQGDVFDPATGRVQARVDLADAAIVDVAVRSARAAAKAWAATSLSRRTSVLHAAREVLAAHRRELAEIITAEHGKVLSDAEGEVQRGLEVVEFACGVPQLLKGGHTESASSGVDVYSLRQPVGVVAAVTPFNFPAMVPLWTVPVAIACGNAVVLKPSDRDPSAAVRMAELWAEAGLPAGVLTVVQGDREAVDALLVHPDVDAVTFVGSTPVARHVHETAGRAGKRVQALGGAKNHMVVLPDADLDAAADAAVGAGFGSAGERCMAVSVLVAVGGTGDALVERLRGRVAGLRVGPGTDPAAEMGPLITGEHRDRVSGHLDMAGAEGAVVAVDGRKHEVHGDPGGFWLGPSVLDHVTPAMSAYREEIFGPVLSVVRVDTLDDALALVNANPYGNGTAVFTRDGAAARRYRSEVQVGMVGVNVAIPVPMAYYSFGGWKDSLFGDTHVHGPEGVHFLTRGKVVTERWPEVTAVAAAPALGFPTST
jgi:malonate-semialdehyde dehydrogenase (acetylating) / methylmalonate-semialdehyde dehydrogenase